MKKITLISASFALALSAGLITDVHASIQDNSAWLDRYRNSNARQMCVNDSFDQKIDAVILNEIPSILDKCGIGGLIDICSRLGRWGSVFGSALGCGGGGGSGGSGSRFCDWGFNAKSAKEAWRIYSRGNTNGGFTSSGKQPERQFDQNKVYPNDSDIDADEIYALAGDLIERDELAIAEVRMRVLGLSIN